MSRTPSKRSRYIPCNAPLSLGYSLRMRARICNASKRTELQLRQLPGAFPSVRQAEEPPPATLSASQWPTAALLWLCMWHANYTLLHIPKTVHLASRSLLALQPNAFHAFTLAVQGGQSIARVDHRAPASWFKAISALDYRRSASNRQVLLTRQVLSHSKTCHRALGPAWWTPPELLQQCEVPAAWNPYLDGTSVYCLVREPFSRFVSVFLEAKRSPRWPKSSCDLSAPLESQLRCFAQHASTLLPPFEYRRRQYWSAIRPDASPPPAMKPGRLGRSREYQFTRHNLNDHIITSELVLSLLPQSHFVTTGQGEPTCDLVFNYDVLSETGISSFGTATRRAAFFAPARVSLRPPWVRSPLLSCCHRRVAVRPTPCRAPWRSGEMRRRGRSFNPSTKRTLSFGTGC